MSKCLKLWTTFRVRWFDNIEIVINASAQTGCSASLSSLYFCLPDSDCRLECPKTRTPFAPGCATDGIIPGVRDWVGTIRRCSRWWWYVFFCFRSKFDHSGNLQRSGWLRSCYQGCSARAQGEAFRIRRRSPQSDGIILV